MAKINTDKHKNPWEKKSSEVKYENRWIKVTEAQVIGPDKKPGIYGTVHYKNFAMGVIALDANLNTWIVGQYRYPIEQYSWEIPEGGGPLNESPLESAKRELKEETGLGATHFTEVLRMHTSNSVSDEYSIVYLATGLTEGPSSPDPNEVLEVKKLPFLKLYEMVMKGEITDAITVATVLKVKCLLDEKKIIL